MTPEGKVKRKVNAALAALGAKAHKFMPVQSGFGMPHLDYIVCVSGHYVAIETKTPTSKPTPRQCATIRSLRAAGAWVYVIRDDETHKLAFMVINALASNKNPEIALLLDAAYRYHENLHTLVAAQEVDPPVHAGD